MEQIRVSGPFRKTPSKCQCKPLAIQNLIERAMIIKEAQNVLKIEAEGIESLIGRLGHDFEKMVKKIYQSPGRVIVSGIGKSGIVGRKIVATLNSTGTRSLFLHPVEAMHGDLGQVGPDDIILALSYSGETDELNTLLPSIRRLGCTIVAFTGKPQASTLAKMSDIIIDVSIPKEACPMGLAPTTSTTAMMAMGDALAVVLINKHHFKASDFKKFHPGGHLGQQLSGRIGDIMLTKEKIPSVKKGKKMAEALECMDNGGLGVVLVVTDDARLAGIITDGDIRRMLARKIDVRQLLVDDAMTANPHSIRPEMPAYETLYLMESREITVLPIVDKDNIVQGIVHLHNILGKGRFRFNPDWSKTAT